jgi:hypothetical protein
MGDWRNLVASPMSGAKRGDTRLNMENVLQVEPVRGTSRSDDADDWTKLGLGSDIYFGHLLDPCQRLHEAQ